MAAGEGGEHGMQYCDVAGRPATSEAYPRESAAVPVATGAAVAYAAPASTPAGTG